MKASEDIDAELWKVQGDGGRNDFASRQRGRLLGNGLEVYAVILIVAHCQQLVDDLDLPVKHGLPLTLAPSHRLAVLQALCCRLHHSKHLSLTGYPIILMYLSWQKAAGPTARCLMFLLVLFHKDTVLDVKRVIAAQSTVR